MVLHIMYIIVLCGPFMFGNMQISNLGALFEDITDENSTESTEIPLTQITKVVQITTKSREAVVTDTHSTDETEITGEMITINTCNTSESFCSTITEPTPTAITNNISKMFYGNKSVDTEKSFNKHNLLESDFPSCTCNLQRQYCDINCCCDIDCIYQDKSVFKTCHLEKDIYRDTSFCQYTEYIYINNTPYRKEINQNGFLCIAKTNLPSKYVVENEKSIKTLEDAELQKINRFSWKNMDLRGNFVQVNVTEYMHGASLWMIKDNKIEEFQLPDKLFTNACLASKKQKYLENFKTECIQTVSSPGLSIEKYDIFFIRAPYLFNMTLYSTNPKECPKNICLPVTIKVNNQENSNLSLGNDVYLIETIYNFYHNGTQGFTRIDLFLILGTFNNSSKQKIETWQKFEVNYFWYNYVRNYSNLLSGNPGYLRGKPILVGNLNTFVNTNTNNTHPQYVITRNSSNVQDIFLSLPLSEGGFCVLNNVTHLLVKFGYNIIIKCRIKENIIKRNFTCGELQKIIFSYWPISQNNYTDINKVVGVFGNANESVPSEWTKIMSNHFPVQILNETLDHFNKDSRVLKCHNILTSLKIDVYHSKTIFKNLVNQEKILATTFKFTSPKELELNLTENSSIFVETNIRAEVVFYDVTAEHVKKYVEPPTFRISLPYDFFYPFIKVDNNANNSNCCNVLFVLVFFCCLF